MEKVQKALINLLNMGLQDDNVSDDWNYDVEEDGHLHIFVAKVTTAFFILSLIDNMAVEFTVSYSYDPDDMEHVLQNVSKDEPIEIDISAIPKKVMAFYKRC